ncbi:MAG: tRNA (adenosine(37)-N6)-threonylcarbamoyltransferase complex ATPase subunit type 1 TsaE [Clostridiaceae bacterium]|nr:tRNA (adenosine(37)-N6)-threonylcarbamoyltransferase complex ATPase subunit type 1 TsaE [Clostridiaceae bacterium]
MIKIISNSEKETFDIGVQIGKTLKPNDIVACFGQLGSGKTVLTKGIASAFNINTVNSPTFTLLNEYKGSIDIYHFDAYRITQGDWFSCGFDEYLFNDGICIIEWAENIQDVLPDGAIKVTISECGTGDYNSRQIAIEGATL